MAAVGALLLGACSNIPEGSVAAGTGVRFVPQVADFQDNTGLGNQVTVDKDGVPYLSYFTFPGVLAKGAIPVARPIGAPYITTDPASPPVKDGAAVGLASLDANGIWTRGAAAQVRDTPSGVVVPFGPATVTSLVGATPENTNGTDVAIDANGGRHVVWTGPSGVYYANAPATGGFTEETVFDYGYGLRLAGPIGRPSVAADDAGTPWVAYAVVSHDLDIRVATKDAKGKWKTTTVDRLKLCDGCPQPYATKIGLTPLGPVVAYIDPASSSVKVASSKGGKWSTETVATGVAAQGLDLAVDPDGKSHLSFYDGAGGVDVASLADGSWDVAKVADVADLPTDTVGNFDATTGVAVDDSGTIYVAWYDEATRSILLASGDGSSFSPLRTQDTGGGAYPSLAVTPDGSMVYVSWYAVKSQDLLLGTYGDTKGLAVAAPSPTSTATAAAPTVSGKACGSDGKVALDQVAKSIQFQDPCLVAPAGQPFSINFDNQDAGIPHNIQIFTDSGHTPPALFSGDLLTGVAKTDYKVGALDAGTYYFDCVVHPTMVGVLAVLKPKK
jgi:plastocyanin